MFTKPNTKLSHSLPDIFNTTYFTNNGINNVSGNVVERYSNIKGTPRKLNIPDL